MGLQAILLIYERILTPTQEYHKAYMKAYSQTDAFKEQRKVYQQTEAYKDYKRAYRQTDGYKAYQRAAYLRRKAAAASLPGKNQGDPAQTQ